MNNILSPIRNPSRLTCSWVPTGDAGTPLVCVWREASALLVERTKPSSLKNGVGRIELCAQKQSIHGEQDDTNNQAQITTVLRTAGRNNEAIEQVVMRLSIEEEVLTISSSIVEAAMD